MNTLVIRIIFIIGTLVHLLFLGVNQLMKWPDSFSYLQMAHHFKNFDSAAFGTGWFGFLYSLPISILDMFLELLNVSFVEDTTFLSAQIMNTVFVFISAIFLYKIGKKYLSKPYNALLLILYFLSPTLLHYNVQILSENLYIMLFLGFFLMLEKFIDETSIKSEFIKVAGKNIVINNSKDIFLASLGIGTLMTLMYFTRSEAFIYFGSIVLILIFMAIKKELGIKKIAIVFIGIALSFSFLSYPYISYLHSISGERGLTTKGGSNIRQAELRGIHPMDDEGFEQAVGELTNDKHHLKGGFAGGLKYDKPEKTTSLYSFLVDNPQKTFDRFIVNQKKLYTDTLPKLLVGDIVRAYNDKSFFFYNNKFFFMLSLFPFLFLIYGAVSLLRNKLIKITEKRNLMLISISLFIIASIFFSLFFILERYFVIFLPIMLIVMMYGAQEFLKKWLPTDNTAASVSKLLSISFILIFINILGSWHYYTYHKFDDTQYEIKKAMGEWMLENIHSTQTSVPSYTILERFPIVTYYSGTKERWITPYVDSLEDLIEYAQYNNIDYLIVDSLDFEKYRPKLYFLLNEKVKHQGLLVEHSIAIPGKKVILYKIEK